MNKDIPDEFKKKIYFRLENPQTMPLKGIAHMKFLDLAIAFYAFLSEEKDNSMTVTAWITEESAKDMGLSVEELFELAKENTPKLFPAKVCTTSGFVDSLLDESSDDAPKKEEREEEEIPDLESEKDMYILSNDTGLRGAATILYPGVLKKISEKLGEKVTIIPSSIHEILLMPYDEQYNRELLDIVEHVNLTELKPQDVLSNSIYLYDSKTDKISVIKK